MKFEFTVVYNSPVSRPVWCTCCTWTSLCSPGTPLGLHQLPFPEMLVPLSHPGPCSSFNKPSLLTSDFFYSPFPPPECSSIRESWFVGDFQRWKVPGKLWCVSRSPSARFTPSLHSDLCLNVSFSNWVSPNHYVKITPLTSPSILEPHLISLHSTSYVLSLCSMSIFICLLHVDPVECFMVVRFKQKSKLQKATWHSHTIWSIQTVVYNICRHTDMVSHEALQGKHQVEPCGQTEKELGWGGARGPSRCMFHFRRKTSEANTVW